MNDFLAVITMHIVRDSNTYFCEDRKTLSRITYSLQLKKRTEQEFSEETSFFPPGLYSVVHSLSALIIVGL